MKKLLSLSLQSVMLFSALSLKAQSHAFGLAGDKKNAATLKSKLKHCSNPQEFFKSKPKADPAYIALISLLCSWNDLPAILTAAGIQPELAAEVLKFQKIWKEVDKGIFSEVPSLSDYQKLGLAKDEYFKDNAPDAPALTLEQGLALEDSLKSDKLTLAQKKNLYYILKLFDEDLVDANISSFSQKIFEQGPDAPLSAEIFNNLVELEVEYQNDKPVRPEHNMHKTVREKFRKSPLLSYGDALAFSEVLTDDQKEKLLIGSEKEILTRVGKLKDKKLQEKIIKESVQQMRASVKSTFAPEE